MHCLSKLHFSEFVWIAYKRNVFLRIYFFKNFLFCKMSLTSKHLPVWFAFKYFEYFFNVCGYTFKYKDLQMFLSHLNLLGLNIC